MTATDDRPVNGHTVNGHKHDLAALAAFRPVVPQQVGPAVPIEQTQPIASSSDTPEPEPASPEPAPVEKPAPPQPDLPDEPKAPTYWGQRGLSVVYWIAIITGAVGQMLAYGNLFGLGIPGYLAAAICATTLESAMVTATATALAKRVAGHPRLRWVPFLLAGFVAALGASALNLLHWSPISASLAALFSGIALLGYVLHVMDGMGEGTQYLARKANYDAEVDRQRQRAEAHANAEYERQRAVWETQQQAAQRAVATVEPATPEPAPQQPKASKTAKSTSKKPKSTGKTTERFTRLVAIYEVGDEFWDLGPAEINRRMQEKGYAQVNPSTIRRWKSQ